jgi:NitT/TauT family transport system permease protein
MTLDDPTTFDPVEAILADAGTQPEARRSRAAAVASVVMPPVVVGVAIIGVWYFVSYAILDPKRRFLLRPPHEVWQVGFADWDNFSTMLDGMWSSTKVAFWGLLIAILLGFLLAVVMSQAKVVERAIFPYAVVLQAIPILAIVPLIGFWFGYGFSSRVLVCVIIALFPIVVNTLFGLLSAEPGMHDLFTLHKAGRLTRLRRLMFPAALPAVFAGLRISAGLSVIGAIVGDFFFGQGEVGIGQLLKRYANRLEGEQLFAAVILSSALGVTVFLFFGWLSGRIIGKWAGESRGR